MIHLDVDDTSIIRRRGSFCGTNIASNDTTILDSFRSGNLIAEDSVCKGGIGQGIVDEDTIQALYDVHRDTKSFVAKTEGILCYALHYARASRGKLFDAIASINGSTTHSLLQTSIKTNEGKNSHKCCKSFVER
jgi:hypothetical protein